MVVKGGWEAHPRGGEDWSNDGGQPETDFVTEDTNEEWKEECCANCQWPNQSWKTSLDNEVKEKKHFIIYFLLDQSEKQFESMSMYVKKQQFEKQHDVSIQ